MVASASSQANLMSTTNRPRLDRKCSGMDIIYGMAWTSTDENKEMRTHEAFVQLLDVLNNYWIWFL